MKTTLRTLIAAALALAAIEPAAAKKAAEKAHAAPARQDVVLGDKAAPVEIIEYASTTCPHCAHFHQTVFPEIKAKYIDTGIARLVYREFPTGPAQFSYVGSVLARCAGEKGGVANYFRVLEGLYANQHPAEETQSWIFGADPKGALLKIVAPAGLDAAAFDACLKRQDFVDLINANVKEAQEKYGVTGTPQFVVNGVKADLKTWSDLDAVIEAARTRAEAKAR